MATPNPRPRFRSDLVATPLEMAGNRFIDVTDPDSEETFRFYEVEYSIACAMDGQRDVGGLIDWARQELGLEPEPEELETVINTLADLGYLAAGADGIELGAPGGGSAAPTAIRATGSADVELGAPGASSLRPERPKPPEAPKLELGAPGKPAAGKVTMGWDAPPVSPEEFEELVGKDSLGPAGVAKMAAGDVPPPPAPAEPKPSIKARGRADDDEDGPTQIPEAVPEYDDEDVSVDLSDHLSIGTDDVKEAVRQSKVMQAVEVPDDLAAALEEEASPAAAEQAKPLEPAMLAREKKADKKQERKVEIPAKPAAEKKAEPKAAPAKEAPAPEKSGSSAGLIIALLIVLAGAAGAYWYLNIYKKKDGGQTAPKPTTGQTQGANKGQPARPAGLPTAKLAAVEADAVEVEAIDDGVIAMIGVEGDEVEEGAVVASLKGVAAVERSLARPRRKFAEYNEQLEAAKAAGKSEHSIESLQKKVDEKRALIEAGEEKLAKLNMLAPAAGTIVPIVEAGAKVSQGDPVVRIVGEPALAATFKAPGKKVEVGGACEIAPKLDPAKPTPCTVDSVENDAVTVRISRDVGFAAGDDVVLK